MYCLLSQRGHLTLWFNLLFKQDSKTDILIQEYIKTDFDVRVLVLGGKVIATMKRKVVEGDFRSNPHKVQLLKNII